MVGMKTSLKRDAQGESNGDQSPSTAGAAGRAAAPPSPELSDGEGVAASREGAVPAEAGSTAAVEAPRWEYHGGHPRRA